MTFYTESFLNRVHTKATDCSLATNYFRRRHEKRDEIPNVRTESKNIINFCQGDRATVARTVAHTLSTRPYVAVGNPVAVAAFFPFRLTRFTK